MDAVKFSRVPVHISVTKRANVLRSSLCCLAETHSDHSDTANGNAGDNDTPDAFDFFLLAFDLFLAFLMFLDCFLCSCRLERPKHRAKAGRKSFETT